MNRWFRQLSVRWAPATRVKSATATRQQMVADTPSSPIGSAPLTAFWDATAQRSVAESNCGLVVRTDLRRGTESRSERP